MENLKLLWMTEKKASLSKCSGGAAQSTLIFDECDWTLSATQGKTEVLTRAHPVLAACHQQPCLLHNYQAFNFSVPRILKFLFHTGKSNRWDTCSKCKPGITVGALECGQESRVGAALVDFVWLYVFQGLFSFNYRGLRSESLLATLSRYRGKRAWTKMLQHYKSRRVRMKPRSKICPLSQKSETSPC